MSRTTGHFQDGFGVINSQSGKEDVSSVRGTINSGETDDCTGPVEGDFDRKSADSSIMVCKKKKSRKKKHAKFTRKKRRNSVVSTEENFLQDLLHLPLEGKTAEDETNKAEKDEKKENETVSGNGSISVGQVCEQNRKKKRARSNTVTSLNNSFTDKTVKKDPDSVVDKEGLPKKPSRQRKQQRKCAKSPDHFAESTSTLQLDLCDIRSIHSYYSDEEIPQTNFLSSSGNCCNEPLNSPKKANQHSCVDANDLSRLSNSSASNGEMSPKNSTNINNTVNKRDRKQKRRKRSSDNFRDILFEDEDAVFNIKRMKSCRETRSSSSKNNRSDITSPKTPDPPTQKIGSDESVSGDRNMCMDKTCNKSNKLRQSIPEEQKEEPHFSLPSVSVVAHSTHAKKKLPELTLQKIDKQKKKACARSRTNSDMVKAKYPGLGFATPCKSKKRVKDSMLHCERNTDRSMFSVLTSTPIHKTHKNRRKQYSQRLPMISDCFLSNENSDQVKNGTEEVEDTADVMADDKNASLSGSPCSSFDVNLDQDSCDKSDTDSELDLPVYALSPSIKQSEIKSGHLVWVKWRNYTHWPAYIRNVYTRKGKPFKLSVQFLAFDWTKGKGFGIRYNAENILPFHCEQKADIMAKGKAGPYKEKFKQSLSIAEDFLNKKALGTLKAKEAKRFFMNETVDLNNSDYEFIKQELMGDVTLPEEASKKVVVMTPPISDDDSVSTCVSDKENERIMARTKRSQRLINMISQPQTKEYLKKIWQKKILSEKHTQFFSTQLDRKKMRNPGFGPINEEQQQEDLITILYQYCKEITGNLHDNLKINYTIDVLVPEAIVYAFTKVFKYSKKNAWSLFHKGVRFTKSEQQKIHESLTDMSDVSPTDIARYAERMRNRMLDMGVSEDIVAMLEF